MHPMRPNLRLTPETVALRERCDDLREVWRAEGDVLARRLPTADFELRPRGKPEIATERKTEMSDGAFIVFGLMALSAIAAYYAGKKSGYDEGYKKGLDLDGWQDEALWWRNHTTGIVAPELSEAKDE
jgi:hypothetical protein